MRRFDSYQMHFFIAENAFGGFREEPGMTSAPQICDEPFWFFQKRQGIQDGRGAQVRTA